MSITPLNYHNVSSPPAVPPPLLHVFSTCSSTTTSTSRGICSSFLRATLRLSMPVRALLTTFCLAKTSSSSSFHRKIPRLAQPLCDLLHPLHVCRLNLLPVLRVLLPAVLQGLASSWEEEHVWKSDFISMKLECKGREARSIRKQTNTVLPRVPKRRPVTLHAAAPGCARARLSRHHHPCDYLTFS